MIKLDDDLLKELGLSALPPEEKKKLLAHIYETLEMRVGMKLAEQMTEAQLSEFEQFIDSNNEAGALQWLETNFPNYKDVVASEFEKLKAEIAQVAPQIAAAAAQAQQSAAAAAAVNPNGYDMYHPQPGSMPPQPQPQQYNPNPPMYQQPPAAPGPQMPPGPGPQQYGQQPQQMPPQQYQ